ncbi:MAG: DMT family transporter [Balneolales bacterium]|nr:DMT family transporter [Balneolales bacterium]
MKKTLIVELSLLTVAVIWALNFTVVKLSLEEIDPMSFNAIRFMMAIVFMFAVLLRSGQKLKVHKGDWPRLILLGVLGNLLYQCLFIVGISYTFAANAAVMLGTIPVWIAVLGRIFFGQELSWFSIAGVFAAFSGIYLIMEGSATGITLESESITGDLIILFAALVFGVYTLFSKQMLGRYTPVQFSMLMMITGGGALILAGIPWLIKLDYASVSYLAWGGTAFSGFLSIGLAYIIWNYGVSRVGPVRTSTFQNLVPVLGLVFGIVLLGEALYFLQYIGSALIIAGIVLARKKPVTRTAIKN